MKELTSVGFSEGFLLGNSVGSSVVGESVTGTSVGLYHSKGSKHCVRVINKQMHEYLVSMKLTNDGLLVGFLLGNLVGISVVGI